MTGWGWNRLLGGLLAAAACGAEAAESKVCRDGLLRDGPGAYFSVIAQVPSGTSATIRDRQDSWVAVTVNGTEGWLPAKAFEPYRAGIDYEALARQTGALTVSSVDLAAATKGMLAARYGPRGDALLETVASLDAVRPDARQVATLRAVLPQRPAADVLRRLPVRNFEHTVVFLPDGERLLGRTLAATLAANGLVDDERLTRYVNTVAAVVGAKTERYETGYRVGILNDASINGFGLPGGYVLLTRGFVAAMRDEAELACALGHEMAHISLYHGVREFKKRDIHRRRDQVFAELETATGHPPDTVEQDLNELANEAYLKIIGGRARADEIEADRFGVAYAAAAGYAPDAFLDLLSRVAERGGDPDRFRHHPPLDERLAALRQDLDRYRLRWPGQVREAGRFLRETGAMASGKP